MRNSYILLILLFFTSCNLMRLINTTEEKNESALEIDKYLTKHKILYDYSFQNIDSTSHLLKREKYRINDSSSIYSYIQLRVFDSLGELYSGYSQCMGSFNKKRFIEELPPKRNEYPFINNNLIFENELELIELDTEVKNTILKEYRRYNYIFVVYWNIWTNYFSRHVLKEVSRIKELNKGEVLVLLVNTAKDKKVDLQQMSYDKPINIVDGNEKICEECIAAALAIVVGVVSDASLHRGTTDRPRDGRNCGCGQCFGMCWPNNIIGDDAFDEALDGVGIDIAIGGQINGNSTIYFLDKLPDHFETEFGIDHEISVVKNNRTLVTIEEGVYSAKSEEGILESDAYGDLKYYGYVTVSVR